jgi:ribosomal protein S18 acetylase RimI-like enzyme
MEIVEITPDEAPYFAREAAKIHLAAYSRGHFTSTFGLPKLTEYNARLIANSEFSLAAVEGGRMLGFLVSGEHVSRGVSEFISDNRLFLIGRMLIHPLFLFEKVLWTIRARISSHRPSSARYRLLSIATAPEAQSSGVGAALLAAIEARLRKRGIERYGLSVLAKNTRAVAFYRRHGFSLEKEELGSAYFCKQLT